MIIIDLSRSVIKRYVAVATPEKITSNSETVYGTVVNEGDVLYVQIDGSSILTPVSSTIDIREGDRVLVLVKNHEATVIGSPTSPTARLEELINLGGEVEKHGVLIADKVGTAELVAMQALIGNLQATDAEITGKLTANEASIETLEAENATINGKLTAYQADIEQLRADKIDATEVVAKYATIDSLNASNANITKLQAADATITGTLDAHQAVIDDLDATYATIDSLNAANANITKLQAADATITGTLDAHQAVIDDLDVTYATITNLDAAKADITKLQAADATITGTLDAHQAVINDLDATYATIANLEATNANVGTLQADVAGIDTLIFGSASGTTIQTSFANAVIAQLGNAQIKSAMIDNISASKITAGDIITNNVRVLSEDGKLLISDETIQISDDTRVRVQIGKDASNDYSVNVWDADGKLMFSAGGITDAAIKDAIIRDDMVSDTANIKASKLDISSLFSEINNSTETINSNKVLIDTDAGTLDVAFTKMTSDIDDISEEVTSQGTTLSVVQSQISSKVWQSDINTAVKDLATEDSVTTLSDQYSALNQTVSGISATVGQHTTQIANKADNSTVTAVSNRVTEVEADLEGFRTEVSETYQTIDGMSGYSTTEQMNSAINQKATEITQSVSANYQTKGDYPTTTQMNSAINQKAGEITQSVSSTYATKTALSATDTKATNAATAASNAQKAADDAQDAADQAQSGVTNLSITSSTNVYCKISGFHTFGWGQFVEFMLYSRAGESVKVNISSNDNSYTASAVRMSDTYSKIHAIYYNVSDNAIYVQLIAWANNIGIRVLSNSNGSGNGTITQGVSLPSTAVKIPIVENADSTDISALSDRVTTTETNINQNAEQIALRATKTELTTVSNAASAAQSTANSAATTASNAQNAADAAQETADDVKTDLANNYYTKTQTEAQIKVSADSIKSTVTALEITLSEDYSTTSEMNSAINQKAGEITQSVSTTYATKSALSSTDTKAANAATAASNAQSSADDAQEAAEAAQSTANTAKANAATAQSTADTAKANAATAQTTANNAATAASNAQKEVDAVEVRITDAETRITQTESDISLRATKTELTTVSNAAAAAQSTANTAKTNAATAQTTANNASTAASNAQDAADAAQSTADGVKTNLANNYYTKTQTDAQIKVSADSITSSVNSTYATKSALATTDTKAANAATAASNAQKDVDALESNVSTNYATKSEVTQTANSITSSVSSTYATKTALASTDTKATNAATAAANAKTAADNAQADIDGLDIGGRNLLPFERIAYHSATLIEGTSTEYLKLSSAGQYDGISIPYDLLELNTQYVLSYDLTLLSGNGTVGGHSGFAKSAECYVDGVYMGAYASTKSLAKDTKVHVTVFMVTSESVDENSTPNIYIQSQRGSTSLITMEYVVENLKIEKGNKATDWTPAPEDVDSDIRDVADSAATSIDNVDTRVTEAFSEIEQLVDVITNMVVDSSGKSTAVQTADGWTFTTSDIPDKLNDLNDAIGNLSTTVGEWSINGTVVSNIESLLSVVGDHGETLNWVTIGEIDVDGDGSTEPCIELGESDSLYKLVVTNKAIYFREGSATPTLIQDNTLVTSNIRIDDEFRQGNFVWTLHNGNYGLIYRG